MGNLFRILYWRGLECPASPFLSFLLLYVVLVSYCMFSSTYMVYFSNRPKLVNLSKEGLRLENRARITNSRWELILTFNLMKKFNNYYEIQV
jgi:hypothetical protein